VTPTLALAMCVVIDGAGVRADLSRPTLSGEERVHLSADGRLRVHYTLAGGDAVGAADADPANGVPDTVDWAEQGAARMLDVFVGEDGWPMPPGDEGLGGDDRIDLYLRGLDANGYAHVNTLPSGGLSMWMEVDPAGVGFGKLLFLSIVGHETHHLLEFAISEGGFDGWIAEATATYAQYLLFSGERLADLARGALWALRLAGAARALDDEDGQFAYAGMVWVKYLVDRGGGDRLRLLELWQHLARENGWERGHDAYTRARLGLSLDEAAADYAVWNWFACGNDDGHHYDEAAAGCGLPIRMTATEVAAVPAGGDSESLGARGSAYVAIAPDCASGDLRLRVRPTASMRLSVIGEQSHAASPVQSVEAPAGVETVVDVHGWNQYERVVLAGTNTGGAPATFHWAAEVSGTYTPPASLPPAARLNATPANVTVETGASEAMAVRADFGTCEDGRDVSSQVTWSSSDAAIAVASGGSVEGLRPGTAMLTATLDGVASNPVTVTVIEAAGSGGCATGGGPGSGALGVAAVCLAWVLWRLTRRNIGPTN